MSIAKTESVLEKLQEWKEHEFRLLIWLLISIIL